MAPDLNSLPPSRSISAGSPNMTRSIPGSAEAAALRGQSPSPSPRSTSTSLQAAAAVNAGLQHEDSSLRRMPPSFIIPMRGPCAGQSVIAALLTSYRLFQQLGHQKSPDLTCRGTKTLDCVDEPPAERSHPSATWRNGQRKPSCYVQNHKPSYHYWLANYIEWRSSPFPHTQSRRNPSVHRRGAGGTSGMLEWSSQMVSMY